MNVFLYRAQFAFYASILIFVGFVVSVKADLNPTNYAVQITASVSVNPPQIDLHWLTDPDAKTYSIYKKTLTQLDWIPIAVLGPETSSFSDDHVSVGTATEYRIIKGTDQGYTAYGYIYAGIQKPIIEKRGTFILVIESSLLQPLSQEIKRLVFDLIGDNWKVNQVVVSANDAVTNVKGKIKAIYDVDPANTRAVMLLGHVPVPYSGNIAPDEHENHRGAWPADVYYGDLDGKWTDESVMNTNAEKPPNWNIPGDGKFDQSTIPSTIELQVGRVDFWLMTCFANKTPSLSEVDLTRQYLDKDHNFRQGNVVPSRQGLILDQIGLRSPEPLAAMAYRNLSTLTGPEKVSANNGFLFPISRDNSFLFGMVCGGGSWTYAAPVGTSDQFAVNQCNVVFTSLIGSYYGDWNNESNLMRAALGAGGMTLTTCYGGKPQWLFHPMGLGATIGDVLKITQENGKDGPYLPSNIGTAEVHISLLGDPSLRAFIVPPPRNLTGQRDASGFNLSWTPSNGENLRGYTVYKASRPEGPYEKISSDLILGASFNDLNGQEGDCYMVKAINLTTTPSGTFLNDSEATFFPALDGGYHNVPTAPQINRARLNFTSSVILDWQPANGEVQGYSVERRVAGSSFSELAKVAPDSTTFEDSSIEIPGTFTYRMRAWNNDGFSEYSNETVATRVSGEGEFAGYDFQTEGDWQGRYGSAGYSLPRYNYDLPPTASVSLSNIVDYAGGFYNDPRAPTLPNDTARIVSSWQAYGPADLDLQFDDDLTHQVSLYTVNWLEAGKLFDCKLIDAVTGALLDNRNLAYTNGVYLTYNIKHHVLFHITPPSYKTNIHMYGFFIDPAIVSAPVITPPGGTFPAKAVIQIDSKTPRAEIHYTLDGTSPTRASPLYTTPFALYSSAVVRAKAFREGFGDSPVVSASYINLVRNQAAFLQSDDTTSGNWPSKYGSQGYYLPQGAKNILSNAEFDVRNNTDWTWNETTDDPRALKKGPDSSSGLASCWYSESTLTLNVSVLDTRSHAIGLYFLDWDDAARVEKVELYQGDNQLVQTFEMNEFVNGKYLVLNIIGIARIDITRVRGPNAVLNGIFLDPSPVPLGSPPKPVPLVGEILSNGSYQFKVSGTIGQALSVDFSPDLNHWTSVQTNIFDGELLEINTTVKAGFKQGFYRVHFLQ